MGDQQPRYFYYTLLNIQKIKVEYLLKKLTKKDIKHISKNIPKSVYIGYGEYNEKFKQVFIYDIPTSYIISSHGRLFNTNYHGKKGDIRRMKTRLDKDGYETAGISFNGIAKTVKIHRLVANAFIKNPKHKPEVNHINGIKTNNGVWNLEWVTTKENLIHALKTGLRIPLKGEEVYSSKHDKSKVIKICEMLKQNKSFQEISETLNVTHYMIHFILRKKRWKHITCNYDFDDYYFGKDVEKIKRICELLQMGIYSPIEIAKMTNSDVKMVYSIRCGHSHKDISKDYVITY